VPTKSKKINRWSFPRTPDELFKSEVEDSIMAVLATEEPSKRFTAKEVRVDKQEEFEKALRRLRDLGCRRQALFYCLGRAKFSSVKSTRENSMLINVPSATDLLQLARRMTKLAKEMSQVEQTGFLDAFEQKDFDNSLADQPAMIDGSFFRPFRALPNTLSRRAEMYKRWADLFSDRNLRRDLLSRVNRLCLSVYVRLATNKGDVTDPEAKHDLVVALMRGAGLSADRSQLRRELKYFENVHFQAYHALRDKLQRLHTSYDKQSPRESSAV
jgi:hypothetical protein